MAIVELLNVSQVFGEKTNPTHALRNVSLEVAPREVVIIMGPSGSGKSTLLAITGALRRPTSGRVIIDGTEITDLNDRKRADVRLRTVGYVFQEFNLLDALNVQQNLEMVMTRAGASGNTAKHRSEELLRLLGLDDRRHMRVRQLSGGQRQRVAIARALANNPTVILADEPTASLDGVRGAEVMGMLRMAAQDMSKSVIMVSHDHRTLQFADRVVWLQDGVIEDREPESMMTGNPS